MKKRIMRLFPVLLALVMVFGSSLTVFAAEDDVSCYANREMFITPEGEELIYSEIVLSHMSGNLVEFQKSDYSKWSKYVVIRNNVSYPSYDIIFYSSDTDLRVNAYNSNGYFVTFTTTDSSPLQRLQINCQGGTWSLNSVNLSFSPAYSVYGSPVDSNWNPMCDKLLESMVCTTHPIYYRDGGEVFFSAPTPMIPTILGRTMKKVGMTGALDQVIAILPICLVCLVGYLALRKALALLQNLLRQA